MAAEPDPEVYLAALQNRTYLTDGKPQRAYITLVVRTAGDPADLAPAVKQAVWSFERNLPISDVLTMDQVVADSNAQPRFVMLLLAVFAAVALLLAAVGIYGVMSYSVSRRTHEIGIRMSLGARPADVLWIVVRQGMAQALAGTAAGVAGALAVVEADGQNVVRRPTHRPCHVHRCRRHSGSGGAARGRRSGAQGHPHRAHGGVAQRVAAGAGQLVSRMVAARAALR